MKTRVFWPSHELRLRSGKGGRGVQEVRATLHAMNNLIREFRRDYLFYVRHGAALPWRAGEAARRRVIGHVTLAWWREDWAAARTMERVIARHNASTRGLQINFFAYH